MNERIKQLAEQAKIDYELLPEIAREPVWIAIDDELEKFAEAIIRECCTALQPALRDMISRGQGRELILEHFGIDPKAITTFMLDRKIAHLEKQLAEQKKNSEVEK